MKMAGYNPAGRAFDLDEDRWDDDYFEDRTSQLSGAGRTSGSFTGGKLIGGASDTPPESSQIKPDYSGFNSWYANNRDRFRGMFTDSNGDFSTADFDRFKASHPSFFTGSDSHRDRMLEIMSRTAGNGIPYTVANSGSGYDFYGTGLDYKHVK